MANDFFSYGGPAAPVSAPTPVPAAPAPGAPVRLLAELGDDDWEKLIGYTAQRRYPPGALIVRAGDRTPGLFFVASGTVRVTLRTAAAGTAIESPATRGEGEVFGLLSFLDGAPHAADVVAASEVELLMLTPDGLTQLAAWQPRIAVALLRDIGAHVAGRLRRLQAGD